jgi:hypothetical protein
VVLALVGCAVATVLTLFQVGVLDDVWEPFFGDGSRRVLTSALSRALPVPDAALGAVAYLAEAVLTALGRPDRPEVVLTAAVVAAGLGLAALDWSRRRCSWWVPSAPCASYRLRCR